MLADVGSRDLGSTPGAETSVCPAVELKFNLDQYVHKRYPGLVKIVRNSRREGLIRARLQGWRAATAPVVGFFDAHVEFSTGW